MDAFKKYENRNISYVIAFYFKDAFKKYENRNISYVIPFYFFF